jgi:hypothetical protein
MAKWTPDQMVERYGKGWGNGEGAGYKPWLRPGDVPSRGIVTEFQARKFDRIYISLSLLERGAILAAQWLDHVTDIREQWPLWPLEETEAIAYELGVTHPTYPGGGGHVMMTTDILLTVGSDTPALEPITVKPSSELNNKRVLEKFEIERIYWLRRNVRLGLVTEQELPKDLIGNLQWMDEYYEITSETLSAEAIAMTGDYLFEQVHAQSNQPLNEICAAGDDRLGYVNRGTCLSVVRHALARKLWKVPLDRKINPSFPLPLPTRLASMAEVRAAGLRR